MYKISEITFWLLLVGSMQCSSANAQKYLTQVGKGWVGFGNLRLLKNVMSLLVIRLTLMQS